MIRAISCKGKLDRKASQFLTAEHGIDQRTYVLDEANSSVDEWAKGAGALQPVCSPGSYAHCTTEVHPFQVIVQGTSNDSSYNVIFVLDRRTGKLNYSTFGNAEENFKADCVPTAYPIADRSKAKV